MLGNRSSNTGMKKFINKYESIRKSILEEENKIYLSILNEKKKYRKSITESRKVYILTKELVNECDNGRNDIKIQEKEYYNNILNKYYDFNCYVVFLELDIEAAILSKMISKNMQLLLMLMNDQLCPLRDSANIVHDHFIENTLQNLIIDNPDYHFGEVMFSMWLYSNLSKDIMYYIVQYIGPIDLMRSMSDQYSYVVPDDYYYQVKLDYNPWGSW